MKCFNCNKAVPDDATCCLHCEADLREMADLPDADMEAAAGAIEQVMPGGMDQLREMAESFDTAEDFANAIFVGGCPVCESTDVGTFAEVVEIQDPTVARCFACGHLWCTECRQPLSAPDAMCGHWAVCDKCGEEEDCAYLFDVGECPEVAMWIAKQAQCDSDGRGPGAAGPASRN